MLLALLRYVFFFNDTATTEIYTLSLHDALPSCSSDWRSATIARFISTLNASRTSPSALPMLSAPKKRGESSGIESPVCRGHIFLHSLAGSRQTAFCVGATASCTGRHSILSCPQALTV